MTNTYDFQMHNSKKKKHLEVAIGADKEIANVKHIVASKQSGKDYKW